MRWCTKNDKYQVWLSHWVSQALSVSLCLLIALRICLQSPFLAHKTLARLAASLLCYNILISSGVLTGAKLRYKVPPGGHISCRSMNPPCPNKDKYGNPCSRMSVSDFGTVITIQWIEFVIRISCCGDLTDDFELRISDKPPTNGNKVFTGGERLAYLPGPFTEGQRISVSSQSIAVK